MPIVSAQTYFAVSESFSVTVPEPGDVSCLSD